VRLPAQARSFWLDTRVDGIGHRAGLAWMQACSIRYHLDSKRRRLAGRFEALASVYPLSRRAGVLR
jgi:hypothetical protein